jgi:hypothetical protein
MRKKEIEALSKKYDIEIFARCGQCGEMWCTLEEWKIIKVCDKCKTGKYLRLYTDFDDTFHAIRELTK